MYPERERLIEHILAKYPPGTQFSADALYLTPLPNGDDVMDQDMYWVLDHLVEKGHLVSLSKDPEPKWHTEMIYMRIQK